MSFDALSWAAKQDTGSSGTKLVLLGLAECASRGHGLAFPSVAELVDFSSLNRKSVIANLDRLEQGGFITDTGRRVGRTGQIKVYQVNVETVPKTEPSQKRNSSDFSSKSPKNGTRNKSEPVNTDAKASCARVVAHWKAKAVPAGFADVEVMNASRTQRLMARHREVGEAKLIRAIDLMIESAFLRGQNDRKRAVNFDFMLQPDKLPRILEGYYGEDAKPSKRAVVRDAAWYERQAEFFESINDSHQAADYRLKAASLASGASSIGDLAAQIVGRA